MAEVCDMEGKWDKSRQVRDLMCLKTVCEQVHDEDSGGYEEATLCLVQLSPGRCWGLIGHIHWHLCC